MPPQNPTHRTRCSWVCRVERKRRLGSHAMPCIALPSSGLLFPWPATPQQNRFKISRPWKYYTDRTNPVIPQPPSSLLALRFCRPSPSRRNSTPARRERRLCRYGMARRAKRHQDDISDTTQNSMASKGCMCAGKQRVFPRRPGRLSSHPPSRPSLARAHSHGPSNLAHTEVCRLEQGTEKKTMQVEIS
jgi:hypothetical protein